MLAATGYMTLEFTGKFPGYLSPSAGLQFADVPNGLAAISEVPVASWVQINAGFTKDGDVTEFQLRRQVKHGRISMLAAAGYMTLEFTGKFPGSLSPSAGLKFADVSNGLAAISKVPSLAGLISVPS